MVTASTAAVEGLDAVEDGGGDAMAADLTESAGDARVKGAASGVRGTCCGGVCVCRGGVGIPDRVNAAGWKVCGGGGCEDTISGPFCCCCCGGGGGCGEWYWRGGCE